jgi:hypothetical protein
MMMRKQEPREASVFEAKRTTVSLEDKGKVQRLDDYGSAFQSGSTNHGDEWV